MALGTSYHKHELRRFAAAADADERTVAKLIRGERVAPCVADRIRNALGKLGVYPPSTVRYLTPGEAERSRAHQSRGTK